MPRVVHVLRKYDPSEWGGTETHVAEVTRRLGPLGWNVEVHAPAGPTASDTALSPDVRLVRYRAFLPFLGPSERRRALVANAGNLASFDEPVRLLLDRRVALAHLHTGGRVGGAVRTAMRLTGRPYVLSVHGPLLANRDWLEQDTKRRLSEVVDLGRPIGLLFGSRRVIDDAARVITFNEEERAALAVRVGDRAVRMDHGVDEARLASGDVARGRARWPAVGDAPVVVLVGRLCAQKNQVFALQAFAAGAPADHHLVLAGAATDFGYRAQVEEEAKRLGIEKRVHVLGNLNSRTEVPDLYALSTLVLVPSTHEAFGLIVLEGWAARRPVLFARHSGMRDLAAAIAHDAASLPTMALGAWSDALGRLLADDAALGANAAAGLRLVRTRYLWEGVASRLADLYEDVLRERG